MITDTSSEYMDDFLNAEWHAKPYKLSDDGDKYTAIIPKEVLQYCAKQDIFVLNFLYQSFKKELSGVILNVEEGINTQLQVSTFFGALLNASKRKSSVLVLCPDNALVKWHYYMAQCGMFHNKIISSDNVDDINEDTATCLLVAFSNIKLIESLKDLEFFSVVIDSFDEVATKMVIRKLEGSFNIGVSYRNFYTQPDQKVQWTMLNWANPGCVGKLADFYEVDNDNFANFRDNYREWWYRMTWNFCESFVKPTLEEKGNFNKLLREWAKEHNLTGPSLKSAENKRNNGRKRKGESTKANKEDSQSEEEIAPKKAKKLYTKNNKINYNKGKNVIKHDKKESSSSDSSDTIIYDPINEVTLQEDAKDELPLGGLNSAHSENSNTAAAKLNNEELEDINFNTFNSEELKNSNSDVSMSSDELLLCSLVSGGRPNKKAKMQRLDDPFDESELILKSIAGNGDVVRCQDSKGFLSQLLDEDIDESRSIDMDVSERMVIDESPTDCDILRGIYSGRSECGKDGNNDFEGMSGGMSDVDRLLAECMEMVRE